ncbi:hypothetical protein Bsp3421_002807 [Burkholderia sp. FERM BP-3421]|jgi:hypothetical protein|uniref:hypothetical protein n=1 Tax=Burkholderia sp. FERM BP-3421 TaxID=1494466 RepID=UPI0023620985|nr:hypothetical protein [Burkholderia sp. FERM BP-3421]WDD92778.1 hypothetical protein Bsp3421_002807 [Burkholderia sp. FERM BP-3421]
MGSLLVAFRDADEREIIAFFTSPQPIETFPHQGSIEARDERYAAFYAAYPERSMILPDPVSV